MTGHILLCPNPRRDANLECTRRAKALLEDAGETVRISPIFDQGMESALPEWAERTPMAEALPGAKLLVCFGGDGTLLHAAREALELLAGQTGAEPVQAIGRKFVLYRRREKDPAILV